MNNKKLIKLTNNLAQSSFKSDKLDEKLIKKITTELKKLPQTQALIALNLYHKALKRNLTQKTLTVESPIALTKNELDLIRKKISKTHQILKTENSLNSTLLAGLRIKIGDFIYDYSLRDKINQLKGVISHV